MRESLNLEIVDALSIRLGVPSSLPMAEKGGATFEHVIGKERLERNFPLITPLSRRLPGRQATPLKDRGRRLPWCTLP